MAGIVDGIYQEIEALFKIPEMLEKLGDGISQLFYAYTIAYLRCNKSKVEANKERFEELLKKLEVEKKQEGLWNWFKKKWNAYEGEKQDVAEYLKKCDDAKNTRQAVRNLYELVNSWEDIKNLYSSISSKIKELHDLFNTSSPINEERYKKGILDVQILTTFTGFGALTKVSKVKTVLKGLKNLSKKQWDNLAKKYGDELSKTSKVITRGSKLFGKTVHQTTTRMGRDGKAVEIIFKDGSKIDINAVRVKQWILNTHPKAPAGALQKVKFLNPIPGSKGYKRLPTQQELEILNRF